MAANPDDVSQGLEGELCAKQQGAAAGAAWGYIRDQGAGHSPVAMETASTDYTEAFHPSQLESKLFEADDGALYTSLTSSGNIESRSSSTYYTGIFKKENGVSYIDDSGETSVGTHSPEGVPAFESRGLFNSDSGIEMTPAESRDVNKALADPAEEDKLDNMYKYMDISRSPDAKPQQPTYQDETKITGVGHWSPGEHSHEIHTKPWRKDFNHDKTPEDLSILSYMEDRCKDKLDSIMSDNTKDPPVKITLSMTETTEEDNIYGTMKDGSKGGLKPSPDMVPTVTVSELEDDSPESLTPPVTDGYTDQTVSEMQSKYMISEDELITAMNAKDGTKGSSYGMNKERKSLSGHTEKQDYKRMHVKPYPSPPADNEVSSAESGDSEIELVSEDQLAAEEAMQSTYMTFSHIGGPPPSPASPSIQYSILREEREAELDSELIIESCDGSSASEESPKREQDSPMMKPMTMDIIEEENGSRTESFDAVDFEFCSSIERKLNMENLAESTAYLKSSYTAEGKPDILLIKKDDRLQQKKASAGTSCQSKVTVAKAVSRVFLSKKTAIDMLYWREVKQTSIVFGSVLLMLFSLTQFSVVSVIAYLALAALSATISFRIYKSVLQAVQKTDEGHPFKSYLDVEISLSQEQIQKYTDCLQFYTNSIVKELRRLFLVQDLVDSLKFAVLMWLLTYVGALFNGLTLLIMAVVSMFSLPAVYDKYQAQIDQYLGLVRTNMNIIVAKIQAKIPGTKQKE
uniref:Reticulon n=1 Tax=Leptobrachium leishanense TaxID=445787 RepID=A0A8C5N1W5_9ANUR